MKYVWLVLCVFFTIYTFLEVVSDLLVAFWDKMAESVYEKIQENGIKYVKNQAMSDFFKDILILLIFITMTIGYIASL